MWFMFETHLFGIARFFVLNIAFSKKKKKMTVCDLRV